MKAFLVPSHKHFQHRTLIIGLILALFLSSLSLVPAPVYADFKTDECTASNAAWLFCDDFEQDRSDQYRTPFAAPPAKLYRQTDTGLDGSNALTSEFVGATSVGPKLALTFGKTPNAAAYKPVGDANQIYKDFYWRTYVKNDAAWSVGDSGTFAQFLSYGSGDQVLAKVDIRYSYGRLYADLYPGTFNANGTPTGPVASPIFIDTTTRPKILALGEDNVGKWNSVEVRIKQNDAGKSNGVLQLWVNDTLQINKQDINWLGSYTTYGFNAVELTNSLGASGVPTQYRYHDNMVLSTARIGTAETTAPLPTLDNALLGSLTVGGGSLLPSFTTSQFTYSVDLPATATSAELSATTMISGATMTVNGVPAVSGQPATVPVGINTTKATIVVTALDGVTTNTYTINLKRPGVTNECANPQEGWLHCDDFGVDQMDKYYDYFKRFGRYQRSPRGIEGSYALTSYYGFYAADLTSGAATPVHGTWMKFGVGKTPDNAVYKPVGDADSAERDLYWRFYTRHNTILPANMNINTGPLARVYAYGPDNVPFMQINVNYPDNSGVLVSELRTGTFDGNGTPTGTQLADTLTGTTPVMAANQAGPWRLIEIHAKLNDPGKTNGVYELWIDGQLESSKTGIDWVGSYTDYGINALELYATNNQPLVPGGDNEWRVFDNMVVSREQIGAAGAVSVTNANLANLSPGAGKLYPVFHPDQTAYTITVENGLASTEVKPVLSDPQATLKVNGALHPTGTPVTLTGASPLTFQVIARDGTTSRTYTVALAKAAPFLVNECSLAKTDWLFCDDYEMDRSSKYFEHSNKNQFYRTSDVGLGGSMGMKAEFRQADGDQHDTGSLKIGFGRTPSSYFKSVAAQNEDIKEVYFRFYLKHEEDWVGGGADKLARLSSMQNDNWAQSMIAHVWSGNNATVNQLIAEPARGTDTAGTLLSTKWNDWEHLTWMGGQPSTTPIYDENNVGNWFAIETRVKLNDPGQSNGIFQVWIDDELQMSRTDLNWIGSYQIGPGKGYGLNWLALENYWNAGTLQDQERYFDNFVVSRSKIGLATTDAAVETVPALAVNTAATSLGGDIELTIAVPDEEAEFNVADFILNYDPQRIEFETVTQGSTTVLADSAFESQLPDFAVASAVKSGIGQLRVLMTSTGGASAANGGQSIIKLRGKIKVDAPAGNASASLSKLELSLNGAGTTVNVAGASVSVSVYIADRAALQTLIASAQQTHDTAVTGSAPGQYSAGAKQALQAAITSASAVYATANATQAQVNAAVAALNAALSTFAASVNPAVNFASLDSKIAAAQAKHTATVEGTKVGQYEAGSKATLQAAIAAAQAVRANASASQSTVNQATTTLNTALQSFGQAIVSLVPGATSISINDLSIAAQYFGTTNSSSNWMQIAAADIFDQGEITIEALAAIARMILDEWAAE